MIGTVRNLADYGAFVDLGGVDGLLHISDISWGRVNKPADVLSVGQQVEVKVLKIDSEKHRISRRPEAASAASLGCGRGEVQSRRARQGTVTRVVDFGAFVEVEPGIEGLIHFPRCRGARKFARPEMWSSPATR